MKPKKSVMKTVNAYMIVNIHSGEMDEEHPDRSFHWYRDDARVYLRDFYDPKYWRIARVQIAEIKK